MKHKPLVFIWQWVGAALLAAFLFPLLLHAAGETAVSPPPHLTTTAADAATQLTLQSLIGPFYTDSITQSLLYDHQGVPQATLILGSHEYTMTNMVKTTIHSDPIHLLLLVDNSGSMYPALTQPTTGQSTLAQASSQLVDKFDESGEFYFSVWSFHKTITHHLDFTSIREEAKIALSGIKPTTDRPTCLYDTLTTAVSAVETFTSSRHRGGIILFTDGRDERTRGEGTGTCSQKARLEEAIAVAKAAFVPIHVVLLPGQSAPNRRDMERLTKETGGTLLEPNGNEITPQQLSPILAPFNQQWDIQTQVYTSAGPQEGILRVQLDNGDMVEHRVRFTAPRAFPAPATLADDGCEGYLDTEFTFALDDDYHQVAFATVQVREINSPDFVTPALIAGDPNHLLPQDGAITFMLHPNHSWTARANYTLQLTLYDNHNEQMPELQRTCTLRIAPPSPILYIEPNSRQVTITNEKFTVDLNVENGSDRWQTLDVYVRHERGWWSPTAELYHYACSSPYTANDLTTSAETKCMLAAPQVGAVKDEKAEKLVEETIITTTAEKFQLTVPHKAVGDSFEVVLQARDRDGHGLLAEPLPYMTGLNWAGRLQQRIVAVWKSITEERAYLLYGLLCLLVLLLGLLLNLVLQVWRQKGNRIVEDQDREQAPKRVRLKVVQSADKQKEGQGIILGKSPVRVGSSETSTLSLPGDGYVSREHLEIQEDNGRYKLIDCNSDNGTKIQVIRGQEAQAEKVVPPGSFETLTAVASPNSNEIQYTRIYIGKTVLQFEEEFV